MKKKIDELIEFVIEKKGKYIDKNHWISGSSTVVYPITIWAPSKKVEIQLCNADKRNFRGFENVLKRKFDFVTDAYFCQSDGSCPDTYRVAYAE